MQHVSLGSEEAISRLQIRWTDNIMILSHSSDQLHQNLNMLNKKPMHAESVQYNIHIQSF